ncbi:MAG: hypothetical protein A2V67_00165 [Deltaproteobacteria bacterium RBG_13_61_14]|nr:MAG: hypothetical protein A2V67_00165 [Deltaproteobacteria bacterium RBG_13_61_14]
MKRARAMVALGLMLALGAKAEGPRLTPAAEPKPEFHFSRLLVMPFARAPARENLWACPRCGRVLMACPIEEGAEATLTRLLRDQLETYPGFEIVDQGELNMALQAIPEPELTRARLRPEFPFTLAQQLKADAVLIPTVTCFRNRSGQGWASAQPSAAAFELELHSVADRRVVWTGAYEEEQKPLLDDLLQAKTFFRRGAKWVTVDVLAREGMVKALASFASASGSATGLKPVATEKP